jgi:uncharacterized protein
MPFILLRGSMGVISTMPVCWLSLATSAPPSSPPDWVLMEVADALAKSECRPRLREFVLHLREAAACEIVPASRELFDRALELFHQHADKEWTLTGCSSVLVMRERGLTEVLTANRHFEQAGFNALLK